MKSIKKFEFKNENSFKIIENGLSSNQLSQMELATLIGGDGYYYNNSSSGCNVACCPIVFDTPCEILFP